MLAVPIAEMIARGMARIMARNSVSPGAKLARLRAGDSDAIPALRRRKIQAIFRPAGP
jgi:hypothetical protein